METRFSYLISAALLFTLASCAWEKKKEEKTLPASMDHPVKETEINTITLTTDAIKRLGIEIANAGKSQVNNSRTYSGEVMAIPGQTISLTAPVAGTLMDAANTVTGGRRVRKGETVYKLLILPSEKDMIGANEDIIRLQQQYEVAVQKVERATQLLAEKAGSLRAKQEAEAELAGINASLRVAKARQQLLLGNTSSAVTGKLSSLAIKAPISGVIQKVYSSPSQVLAAAAPIADIASTDRLWVRVPIYAGDFDKVDRATGANILLLSGFTGSAKTLEARVVEGPQTADPTNTSVDLYYEVDNSGGELVPGGRVSANVPLKGNQNGIIIPYSSIVYDIHGNSWVYLVGEKPNSFTRKRIEILNVSGKNAVIKRGLKNEDKIVAVGAAELFGFEFGGGK